MKYSQECNYLRLGIAALRLYLTKIRKSTKGASSQSSYLMLVSQENSCGNVVVGKYEAQVQTVT